MNIPKKCHKIKVFKGIELIKTIRKTIKEIILQYLDLLENAIYSIFCNVVEIGEKPKKLVGN